MRIDGVVYPESDAKNPFDNQNGHMDRAAQYIPHFARFGLNQLQYPINPREVGPIDDLIKLKIKVFSFFDELGLARYQLYLSEKQYKREVDLLYWNEHFALITSISGFFSDLSKHRGRMFICRKCFGRHITQQALDKHKPYCNSIDQANQVYLLPDEGSDIHFKNVRYLRECPVVIYSVFQCKTAPIEDKANGKNFYQDHRPTSYA